MTQNDNLYNQLKAMGFKMGNAAIREDGVMLVRVNDVFMYRTDAVDLASGTATIADILARNAGKIFPDSPYKSVHQMA
jgi:hypothetical protein